MTPDRMRILVTDDDATTRLLMRAALEKFGFAVHLAEDGEDALRQFHALRQSHALPWDMVMLDVEMPGLNGYQVCAQLRNLAGDELPIVMVTGMDDLGSIERAFEAGATDFIAKPIKWALIGHRVRYLFRAYQVLQDLNRSNARNAAILNALPDTLVRMDAGGQVLDMRRGGEQAQEYPYLPRPGYRLEDSYPAEVAAGILAAAAEARTSGAAGNLEFKLALDAGERHFEARLANIDHRETLCLLRDITERKTAESRIYHLAYFDTLTGLPNRLSFAERLDRETRRARHRNDKLAVLFMDLDRFKNVNDTLGHGAGDLLLQLVADRLRKCVRPADLVARADYLSAEVDLARLGGDEFTLLLPQLRQSEHALSVAQRIHEMMHRPFMLEGREVVVTASVGIAVYPDDGEDAASLLKHADTAMYHAKDQGRDTCKFYSASLTEEAMRRLDMESDLRLALERNEFFLAYQPQLDLASGAIRSLEALIRWNHPRHGLISPMKFIPVAEENGLILSIGEWVLRTACADAVRWQAAGHPLRVAVNLSAKHFRNPGLIAQIGEILRQTGLAPEWLELEVTEGALMEDSEAILTTLRNLRALGMQLSLDDFGTGYSCLSYLKRLPLNNLKVDQSFVRNLPADRESLAIVCAIVALAGNLGFTVTVEGIETLEQARIMRGLECETLQGYWIAKPVPAEEIPALLGRRWIIDAPANSEPESIPTRT